MSTNGDGRRRLDLFRIIIFLLLVVVAIAEWDRGRGGFGPMKLLNNMVESVGESYAHGSPAFQLSLVCVALIALIGVIKVISRR